MQEADVAGVRAPRPPARQQAEAVPVGPGRGGLVPHPVATVVSCGRAS